MAKYERITVQQVDKAELHWMGEGHAGCLPILCGAILLAMLWMLTGCDNAESVPGTDMVRYYDPEADVVCWSRDAYTLSCLPRQDTALPEP